MTLARLAEPAGGPGSRPSGWHGLGAVVAGWPRTGLASRRVAAWAGPEPSLRHVRQAWPAGDHAFQDKNADFRNCQHIFDKSRPMDLDADEPRKFQGPPDRILGQPTWVRGGGGAGRQNFGCPWPLCDTSKSCFAMVPNS